MKLSRVAKVEITVFVSLLIALIVGCMWYFNYLQGFALTPGPSDQRVEITIPHGTNSRSICRLLEEQRVVSSGRDFFLYLRYVAKKSHTLQAGDYLFEPHVTPESVAEILQKGFHKEYRFTVPEGAQKYDIARLVAEAGLVSVPEMKRAMADPKLLQEFGIPDGVPGGIEGYLFPDTYKFPKKTPAETILRRMHARLEEVLDPDIRARMAERQMSLHQVLTLASIVEKETGSPAERPVVAGLFFNRLKKKMKLQTDPTVIYSVADFNGNLQKKHLQMEHPYNTYVIYGLPPGPIASPGKQAIVAVLWPADTKYIYFVSKNDGTHVFCETYTCHLRAVRKWQVNYFK